MSTIMEAEDINEDFLKDILGKFIYKGCEVLMEANLEGLEVANLGEEAKKFIRKLKSIVKNENRNYLLYRMLLATKLELPDKFNPLISVLCKSRPTPVLFNDDSSSTYAALKGKYGKDVDYVLEEICINREIPEDSKLLKAVETLCN
ncbi:DgyrCDS8522 [Dimorphilus gyrociliatus]|uniref:DgyrCDS8522 n=1 Tax=Dimorphilus gyrociliatus TaxID=2664684 RepID=A0A7I8VUN0_9ANNE|nr:DgyrCDS8522 [Dimorphilus gyrociliatus]